MFSPFPSSLLQLSSPRGPRGGTGLGLSMLCGRAAPLAWLPRAEGKGQTANGIRKALGPPLLAQPHQALGGGSSHLTDENTKFQGQVKQGSSPVGPQEGLTRGWTGGSPAAGP